LVQPMGNRSINVAGCKSWVATASLEKSVKPDGRLSMEGTKSRWN
jgi:hypothetical protein